MSWPADWPPARSEPGRAWRRCAGCEVEWVSVPADLTVEALVYCGGCADLRAAVDEAGGFVRQHFADLAALFRLAAEMLEPDSTWPADSVATVRDRLRRLADRAPGQ